MKKIAPACAAAVLLAALPAAAPAEELDDVLAAYYESIGGLDAIKAIDSARMTGTMSMQGGMMTAPFTMTFKRPGKARLEFTVQGMTGVQAYDGETAWSFMPFMGKTEPEPMPAEQAKMMKEQADFDGPLVDFESKGIEVELVGADEVEGTDAIKLKVTLPEGDVRHYYLDAEHKLPILVEAQTQIQGQQIESQTVIGDYKDVGGKMMAHSMSSKSKGAPEGSGQTITIDTIDLNVEVADDFFTMPLGPGS